MTNRLIPSTIIAATSLLVLGIPPASALDPAPKCESAKLKAAGKYSACRFSADSKGVKKGETADYAKCDDKLSTAWQKAEEKGGFDCPTTGDEAEVQAKIAGCTDTLTGALSTVRFVDNGDETVTDNDTGLMWEQKVVGSGCQHCVSDQYDWFNGNSIWISELNGLNDDPGLAGYKDWRVPTSQELQTILDLSQGACGGGSGPCIDPIFGPTAEDNYWSSTTTNVSGSAAYVDFVGGAAASAGRSGAGKFRAVRRLP